MRVATLSIAKSDLKEIHLRLSEYGEVPPKKFRESFEKSGVFPSHCKP